MESILSVPLSEGKALLLEEDEFARTKAFIVLREGGYEVVEFASAKAAETAVRKDASYVDSRCSFAFALTSLKHGKDHGTLFDTLKKFRVPCVAMVSGTAFEAAPTKALLERHMKTGSLICFIKLPLDEVALVPKLKSLLRRVKQLDDMFETCIKPNKMKQVKIYLYAIFYYKKNKRCLDIFS
jgi:hypothetical protein